MDLSFLSSNFNHPLSSTLCRLIFVPVLWKRWIFNDNDSSSFDVHSTSTTISICTNFHKTANERYDVLKSIYLGKIDKRDLRVDWSRGPPPSSPFHFFFSFNSFSKQRSFVYKRSFNWEICVTQASKVTVSDFILWFRHSKGWCANIAQQLWIMPGISTLAIIGTFLELFRKNWWYLSLRREIIITLLCVLFFVSVLYISKTWWWFIGKVVQSVA